MKALLAQLAPTPGDLDANVLALEGAVREHADVDLAIFPELFLCGYEPARAQELACPANGAMIGRIRAAAAECAVAVVVGFAEQTEAGRVANSAVCIDTDGRLAGVYRKTHLFARERNAFAVGETLLLSNLCGLRVGPLICFDIEFPEPARQLCLSGAEVLVTIAANMAPYAADHALAARARALENRRTHLYVNRVGSAGDLHFVGQSCAIDATGTVTASAEAQDMLLEVEIPIASGGNEEVDYLKLVRDRLPVSVVSRATDRGDNA